MKNKCIAFFGALCVGILLCLEWNYASAENYVYDDLNRITKVTYEDGSYVEYGYDNNGNITYTNVYVAEIPEVTGVPEKPEVTEAPEEPEVTETPEKPEITEAPEVTEAPENPGITKTPEEPKATEAPEKPGITKTPEEPEATEAPEKPKVTETPERPEVTETPEKPEITDKPEKPDQPIEPGEDSNESIQNKFKKFMDGLKKVLYGILKEYFAEILGNTDLGGKSFNR